MTAAKFLSGEWCEVLVREAAAAGLEPKPGVTVTYEVAVRHDDGTRNYFTMYFVDGRLDRAEPHAAPDADMHVESPYDVYVAYVGGDFEAVQRSMLNGTQRIRGDLDKGMLIHPIMVSPEFVAMWGRVHAQTLY